MTTKVGRHGGSGSLIQLCGAIGSVIASTEYCRQDSSGVLFGIPRLVNVTSHRRDACFVNQYRNSMSK